MKKIISIISVIALTVSMMSTIMAEETKVEYLNDIKVMNGEEVVDLRPDEDTSFDVQVDAYEIMVDYKTEVLSFEPVLLGDWDRAANHIITEVQKDDEDPVVAGDLVAIDVDLAVGTTVVTVRVIDDNEPLMVDDQDTLGEEDVVEEYTIEISRANILEDIDVYIDTVGVEVGFDSNVLEYEVPVVDTTTEAAIMVEVAELPDGYISQVEMTYDGVTEVVEDGEALEIDDTIDDAIKYGSNLVTIEVFVAEDTETPDFGEAVETYTVDLIQSALLGLEVKNGEDVLPVDPDFAQDVLDYEVAVLYGLDEVTLIADLVEDVENSSIEIDGNPYTSGEALLVDGLVIGSNVVEIVVTVDGTELLYTVDLVRADVLVDMDVLYDDDPSEEFEWEVAPMSPGFISIIYDYEVTVKPNSNEVKFDFELEESSEDVVIKVDGGVYSEELMYLIEPGMNEFDIALFADSEATEALATYDVTVLNPVPLLDLEVTRLEELVVIPVENFDFDPLKKNQSITVDFDVEEVTLAPSVYDDPDDATISEEVTVTVDGVDITVTPSVLVQSLDEGRNVIEIATEYDGASYEYRLTINRKYDSSEKPDPEAREYHYTFRELFGEGENNGDMSFGEGAYHAVIKAFKYGSNRDNEITFQLDEDVDGSSLMVSYEIFKYLTQHKVMLLLDDGSDIPYKVSLKDLKLNRYIKGPHSTAMVELEFELVDGVVEVSVKLDNQKPEDHKSNNGNSGKSNNGKSKK